MGKTIRLYGFSGVENPKDVMEFVEEYTGEGTVYAVEVGQYKNQRRAYAKVQFTSEESAEIIMDLAEDQDERFWYDGDSYLEARELDLDIEKKPKVFVNSIDDVTLYFGGQISEDKFSGLWKRKNVLLKFGMGLRNFYFFFSYRSVEYKLEVPYESIWKIELRRPRGQATKFLLIQLIGAPKIYEKDVPVGNYFKDAPNKYWVREVDFTPSSSIGQSSAICLELPYRCQLPDLSDRFIYYKEEEGNFELEKGDSFSSDSNLVPIVDPPPGINLPYKILFKINSLVQHGCLPGQVLDINFFRLVDPSRINIHHIECALNRLYHLKECCYNPVKWLKEQYRKNLSSTLIPQVPSIALDEGLAYVYRVQVTPSKVYFCGPEINLSNRVLRNYPEDVDNFLRVSFVDEDLDSIYSTDLSPRTTSANDKERRTRIYERILSVLKDGIVIGDKKFEFLAFSSSQLKDNSVWMFASRPGLNAEDIREWMGDFRHIRIVAKYAARLGQSFSSSRETLSVFCHEREMIPDIEVKKSGIKYCFSDGIGKISAEFAEKVARKCSLSYTPSAFQIRYGGYKGVVAIDPTSSKKLSLRESMCKYKSKNIKLDVLSWSSYHPCFLNRQIITLLSTLGVKDHVFIKKQKEEINQLKAILTDPLRAQQGLELMFPGENANILKEMLVCGYKPNAEPFLAMMLQTLCASKLLELRTKTRIYIPNGRSVIGCLDETGTLEYGQVFVKCSRRKLLDDSSFMFSDSSSSEDSFVVRGKVVVAKNPCLHPGDVRVLMAVDVPALHHIVDCVAFPQKGERPHPNECSGSDLDGDIYFVSWDPDLIPRQQIDPMDYTPEPITELDHDVTMEEVEEYFTNYMVNDVMGIIASAHTVFADSKMKKAMSDSCLELAKLFSIAVDFSKTGVPAKIPPRLRVKDYPDFMEKFDKPTYESKHVIGKLFRQVKDVELHSNSIKSFTKEVAKKFYDPDLKVDGFWDYVADAFMYKNEYDYKLGNLMDYYGFKTEAEVLTGNVIGVSKFFNKKRDLESVNYAVKSLRKEARSWFNAEGNEESVNYAKASAWYYVTYHPSYWGCYNKGMKRDYFLSFPWCVYDKLTMIKKNKIGI